MRHIMRHIFLRILAFIVSLLTAVILATFFSTQFIIAGLKTAGADVSLGQRFSMSLYDIINMGPIYAIFITIGLPIAFLVAGLIFRKVKIKRALIYTLAGAACFLVMLYLMKAVFFGVPIIGGARTPLGLMFQALAGGIAGYIFARLTAKLVKPI
ncbi:MAG: hypothetical protein JKX72_12125 [Robiginitomaculum sp.]|nr:hypothetical protein [Robiginitomaculum sp.]